MRKICLCGRCLRDYITAGYIVRRDYYVGIKDTCEICDRMGWTYWIERNLGEQLKDKHKE